MMEGHHLMNRRDSFHYDVTSSSMSPPPPPWVLFQKNDNDNYRGNFSDYSDLGGVSISAITGSLLPSSTSTIEPVSSAVAGVVGVIENDGIGESDTQDFTLSSLPMDFTEISELNKHCIIVYTILFFLGAVGNILVLSCVSRHDRLRKSRTHILIMNLCIADFIVILFLMPTEIFWRYTIAWEGGDLLCRFSQFLRAFGLYLCSNVVICISVDRYFAIVYPLKLAGAVKRVKWMLVGAWIVSAVFAGPQMFIYHVASHPVYTEFRQCVTKAFLTTGPYNELIYNVSSVAALYFIPLLVIMYTYTMILWKIHRKSREQRDANSQQEIEMDLESNNLHHRNLSASSSPTNLLAVPRDVTVFHQPGTGLAAATIAHNFLNRAPSKRTRLMLRSTANQTATLTRARSRTLRLTLLILITFIFCWTPYVVMTLWYMLDRGGASQVDERLQETLFIMAVTNSVLNPMIYGTVGRKQDCRKRFSFLQSSSRARCLLKSICCFSCIWKRCCEPGDHNNSETVVITLNRLNNGSCRNVGNGKNHHHQNNQHHSYHENHSQHSYTPPPKNLSPLSPLPNQSPRSQIVKLRGSNNNSGTVGTTLSFVKSFVPGKFRGRGDGNNGQLLVKETDECFECGVPVPIIAVQYIVPPGQSSSSSGPTHV